VSLRRNEKEKKRKNKRMGGKSVRQKLISDDIVSPGGRRVGTI
jgi:hypothetical protein